MPHPIWVLCMLTVYGCIQYCMGYLEIVYYICILYVVYCILYFGKSYIVNRILYLVVCFLWMLVVYCAWLYMECIIQSVKGKIVEKLLSYGRMSVGSCQPTNWTTRAASAVGKLTPQRRRYWRCVRVCVHMRLPVSRSSSAEKTQNKTPLLSVSLPFTVQSDWINTKTDWYI